MLPTQEGAFPGNRLVDDESPQPGPSRLDLPLRAGVGRLAKQPATSGALQGARHLCERDHGGHDPVRSRDGGDQRIKVAFGEHQLHERARV